MGNALYETWWMNLDEGGIYYRNTWYRDEQALNDAGYYLVYDTDFYLGARHFNVKYQNNLYLLNDEYDTYENFHARGYSKYESSTYMYADLSTMSVYQGYTNSTEGYYAVGNWYQTIADIQNAGYSLLEDCIDQFIVPLPTNKVCGGNIGDDLSSSYHHEFMYSMSVGSLAPIGMGNLTEFNPTTGGVLYIREPQYTLYPYYEWEPYTGQIHNEQYMSGTLRSSTVKLYDTHYIEQYIRPTMKIDD